MNSKAEKLEAFSRLLDIMDELRAQCPWDKKQTLQSLRALTLEEVYELSDALQEENLEEIKKEIGDVLLHLVFYAKIGSEKKAFDIADVIHSLNEKLIYRHPHIYGEISVKDEEEVKKNWEKLKLKEGNSSVLSGVPKTLPSIIKAYRIQDKARGIGFEFEHPNDAWKKVLEEMEEFHKETNTNKKSMEFGDILFSLINYARLQHINADTALEQSNKKFIRRFQRMEQLAKEKALEFQSLDIHTLDTLWNEAKKTE